MINVATQQRHRINLTVMNDVIAEVREHADRDLKEIIDDRLLDAPFRRLFLLGFVRGPVTLEPDVHVIPTIASLASVSADMSCHVVTGHRLLDVDPAQADIIKLAYVERMVHELTSILTLADSPSDDATV